MKLLRSAKADATLHALSSSKRNLLQAKTQRKNITKLSIGDFTSQTPDIPPGAKS